VKLPPGRQIERLHRHLKVDMVRVDPDMGVPAKEVAKLNHRSNLPLVLCRQHFIFFVTYKWDQSAREFVSNKHSSAQCNDPIHITKKIKCCEYDPCLPNSGANVIKPFFSSQLTVGKTKLECLPPGRPFQSGLILGVRPGASLRKEGASLG
jgi:hypothetical protein